VHVNDRSADGCPTTAVATTAVVWNPWVAKAAAVADFDDEEWPTMVCVETANVGDDAVVLEPARSHAMRAVISG
jgi:glucose-6-phosphate 1-epimerase